MRNTRARLRRSAVAFVVGLLVVLPTSALAAPGGLDRVVQDKPDTPASQHETNESETSTPIPSGRSADERGRSGDGGSGRSGDAPGRSGDATDDEGTDAASGRSAEAPGRSDDDGSGRSGEAPGRSDGDGAGDAPGRSASAPGRDDAIGPPSPTPSGVEPTTRPADPAQLVAAIVMLDVGLDEDLAVLVTPAEPPGLAGDLASALGPVMPPVVVDAVTSPIVIVEALVEAMASSGQALVIPFLAAGIGFFLPGMRRRDLIAAVTSER